MMTMIPSMTMTILIPFAVLSLFKMMNMQTVKDREKLSTFECGFDPHSKARIPFSMRFFLLAVLFLVFDIEIMFIMPICILTSTTTLNYFILPSGLFIFIVTMGLFHEWNEGSLKWSN